MKMATSQVNRFGRVLQAEIERTVASPVRLLHDMLSFQTANESSEGDTQRLPWPRGTLCLLVGTGLSRDHRAALPIAAAVELAHQQFVVHHGIELTGNQLVGDDTRIEGRWGCGQAINAGDGMHALARLSLMRLGDNGCDAEAVLGTLRAFDDACARTCEGLHRELLAHNSYWSVDGYVEMAALKTGSLMGCAAQLGALIAGKGAGAQQRFQQCGADLGVALQISEEAATSNGFRAGRFGKDLEQAARHKVSQAGEDMRRLGLGQEALAELERLAEAILSAVGAEERLD